MRLTPQQIANIRRVVAEEAGFSATVKVFGSRLDDNAKGGDLDLLVTLPEPVANPALLAARVSGRLTRLMGGREVDVLLWAPNLQKSGVHEVAEREGRSL